MEKIGNLICLFQIIENDIKWIYSLMSKGNPNINYESVKKYTLGRIIDNLEILDKADGEQFLSDQDYEFLKKMTRKRNYWCHQCFRDFIYIDKWENSKKYRSVCESLDNDLAIFIALSKDVEEAKIEANDYYGRI